MSHENPIVVVVYLFTVLSALFWLAGLASDYLEFRERVRRIRK